MSNLKKALLLGVLGSTAAVALAGFFLLGTSPARLVVDGGLAFAQLIIILLMLSPTEKRIENLVDALRALSRGERHQRVDADQFAGLSEVARAMNEVAASLTENDDANLGPVKSTPRKKSGAAVAAAAAAAAAPALPPTPLSSAAVAAAAAAVAPRPMPAVADDPNVGQVRKLKKDPPAAAAPAPAVDVERPARAAPSNDTAVDDKPRSASGDNGAAPADASAADASPAENGSSDAPAELPTRDELDALFHAFVAAKKAHNESVADLELEAFVQTIMGECERLVNAHKCRGVKFEITEQDNEVSLRPRLLR